MQQDEDDEDDDRDNATRAENAKRKLPKWTAVKVVDSICEVNSLVASFLPKTVCLPPKRKRHSN
jgi:hypothetical protein